MGQSNIILIYFYKYFYTIYSCRACTLLTCAAAQVFSLMVCYLSFTSWFKWALWGFAFPCVFVHLEVHYCASFFFTEQILDSKNYINYINSLFKWVTYGQAESLLSVVMSQEQRLRRWVKQSHQPGGRLANKLATVHHRVQLQHHRVQLYQFGVSVNWDGEVLHTGDV